MLKRTLCLIALLAGNPLLLAGQGTETTLKPHKKEVWPLLKKIKRACVNHPIGATLGVATAITAATAYVSTTYTSTGSKTEKPPIPVSKRIELTVQFEGHTYRLYNVETTHSIRKIIALTTRQLGVFHNPAYQYRISYNGTKIEGNYTEITLAQCGIQQNAQIELIADKQPMSLTVKYGGRQVIIRGADKRNTFGWLKKQLFNRLNISVDNQVLILGANENSSLPKTTPKNDEKFLSYEKFLLSDNPANLVIKLT